MSKGNVIHIVTSTDNNYVQHLGATFTSLLINISKETTVNFHVIGDGLTLANKMKLERTVIHLGGDIAFIEMDSSPYASFHVKNHITRAAYYRIAIPEIITEASITKVIYLDCDVIVTGDINELWDINIDGYAIAAVPDLGGGAHLRIPEGYKYFNSGVMVMNLKKWRDEDIIHKVMNFIALNTGNMVYHDQDGLNAILYNDWKELPNKWNVQSNMVQKGRWRNTRHSAIIHFTGSSKPWNYDNVHPYKDEYYKYLKMTEWKYFKPKVTMKLIFKRLVKNVLPQTAIAWLIKTIQ